MAFELNKTKLVNLNTNITRWLANIEKTGTELRTVNWANTKLAEIPTKEAEMRVIVDELKALIEKLANNGTPVAADEPNQLDTLRNDILSKIKKARTFLEPYTVEDTKTKEGQNELLQKLLTQMKIADTEKDGQILQRRMLRSLTRLENLLQEMRDNAVLTKIEAKYKEEVLSKSLDQLLKTADDIEESGATIPEAIRWEQAEKDANKCIIELRTYVNTANQQAPVQGQLNTLPNSVFNVKMRKFDGIESEYNDFKVLFNKNVVQNAHTDNVSKQGILRSLLEGRALRLVKDISLSEDGLKQSLDVLDEEYQNNRRILEAHILKITQHGQVDNNAEALREYLDLVTQKVAALHAAGKRIDTDQIFPTVVYSKLSAKAKNFVTEHQANKKLIPTWEEIRTNLKNYIDYLCNEEAVAVKTTVDTTKKAGGSKTYPEKSKPVTNQKVNNQNDSNKANKCMVCQSTNHRTTRCPTLIQLGVDERISKIKQMGICKRCLSHLYKKEECKSTKGCFKCGNTQHNTLLHKELEAENKPSTVAVTKVIQPAGGLLPTIKVHIKTEDGRWILKRALLDQCSDITLIKTDLVKQLGLTIHQKHIEIEGSTGVKKVHTKVDIEIAPWFNKEPTIKLEAFLMKHVVRDLPAEEFIQPRTHLVLADPDYNKSNQIDILFGVQLYNSIMLESRCQKVDSLTFQETELGWIVSGEILAAKEVTPATSYITKAQIETSLTRFWEMEQVSESPAEEIDEAETIYRQTTQRDDKGRFIVNIPFKNDFELGKSKSRALGRFFQLEKRLQQDPELKREYALAFKEYQNNGWMVKGDSSEKGYFIPHQAVIKKDNLTTKVRVVFDASMKSDNGLSLNDSMHAGKKIQPDLQDTIQLQRKYRWVISADIKQMYPHININPDQWIYQKIIWRENPWEPIQYYYITVVVQGQRGAQFLSVRSIKELTLKEHGFTLAKQMVNEELYADNFWGGANSREVAMQKIAEIDELLKRGGFILRKWATNDPEILHTIKGEEEHLKIVNFDTNDAEIKTLGIQWNPVNDEFTYKINQPTIRKWTKRVILSEIASIFDPEGWLTPLLVECKLLMQEIWRAGTGWDEKVPDNIEKQWEKIRDEIPLLETVKIPRWIGTSNDHLELIGFCDASNKAIGTAVYSRVMINGTYIIRLISSKSKVVPIKEKPTLPRLELNGAHLLAKQMIRIESAMKVEAKKFYFTDSMIVLAWLARPPSKWTPYVATRVKAIQSLTNPTEWNHVKSEDNPADLASRGALPNKFLNNLLWWEGPSWLQQPRWEHVDVQILETDLETKKSTSTVNVIKEIAPWSLFSKDLTWIRLKRVVARILRIKTGIRGIITAAELATAEAKIIRAVQLEKWAEDINHLNRKIPLPNKSKLHGLNPYLDEEGIMRVGSRILNAELPTSMTSPILLPKDHPVTTKIIKHVHIGTLHAGTQLTLAKIRECYWIPQGRSSVSNVLRKCLRCHKYKNQVAEQIMGILPKERVNPSYCFKYTGVDYAGPIQVKGTGRGSKPTKGYIAVFVCLATKAIHLELVPDMTSKKFINALTRFISLQNKPTRMFSDNGTTFVGTKRLLDKELKEAIQLAELEGAEYIANDGIEWSFIPPSAPHFGGLWEAGVKSMKTHLKRALHDHILNFEEMETMLYQIAACLNARPLTPLTEDPEDLQALTPAHFMIKHVSQSLPSRNFVGEKINLADRYKLQQTVLQNVWCRWQNEYLTRLHQRNKWTSEKENLKVGDLVLLKEDNLLPGHWPLGRVLEIHPGSDGLVRVATVKTKTSVFKRPIHKLSRLPMPDNPSSPLEEVDDPSQIDEEGAEDNQPTQPERQDKTTRSGKSYISTHILLVGMVMACLSLCLGQKLKPLPHTDLLFAKQGQILVQRGIWHLYLNTNVNTSADMHFIDTLVTDFSHYCAKTGHHMANDECSKYTHNLQLSGSRTKKHIHKLEVVRQKRSAGIIKNIWNLAFGSNLSEEELENVKAKETRLEELSTTIIKSTKRLEQEQLAQGRAAQELQDKYNQVVDTLEQGQQLFKTLDTQRADILLFKAYTTSQLTLQGMREKYISVLEDAIPEREEFSQLYYNLTTAIGHHDSLLNSSFLYELKAMFKVSAGVEDDIIHLHIAIPLIDASLFTEALVIPIPDDKHQIVDITRQSVAYNHIHALAFTTTESNVVRSINGHKIIMQHLFVNGKNVQDCILEHLFRTSTAKETKCHKKSLPTEYNVWIDVGDYRTLVFYASKKLEIEIICNKDRTELHAHQGILQMNPGCTAKEADHTVIATYDRKSSLSEIYLNLNKVDFRSERSKFYLDKIPNQTKVQLNIVASSQLAEVVPLEQPATKPEIHIALWVGMVLLTMILICLILFVVVPTCRKWYARRSTTTTNNSNNSEVEMEVVEAEAHKKELEPSSVHRNQMDLIEGKKEMEPSPKPRTQTTSLMEASSNYFATISN